MQALQNVLQVVWYEFLEFGLVSEEFWVIEGEAEAEEGFEFLFAEIFSVDVGLDEAQYLFFLFN